MTEPSPQPSTHFPLDEQMEATPKDNTAQDSPTPTKKSARWPWLLLGLGAGSAITLGILPYLPQAVVHKLHLPVLVVGQPAAPTPPPVTTQVTSRPAVDEQAGESLKTEMQKLQARLSAIANFQDDMQTLSADLQQLHQTQQQVRKAQHSIETMQLHSRLSWVLHPASHLPQIRLAWEEIVLLPSLTEAQRQQASDMLALAQKRSEDVAHWQQELDHLIASYQMPEAVPHNALEDWLPQQGTFAPFSQWLSRQWQVYPIAPQQKRDLLHMRQQLMQLKQHISLEKWPDHRDWAALRSRLQLHLPKGEVLNLPESFSGIQQDLQQLRQTAQQWLQES